MHVEMRIGDSLRCSPTDFSAEFGMPPLAVGRFPFILHLYVPDADATWNQAVAAGCERCSWPIADQFWATATAMCATRSDSSGPIATRKEDLTPEELRERQAKAFGAGIHRFKAP